MEILMKILVVIPWLSWLLILTFCILPSLILVNLYINSVFVHIFRLVKKLPSVEDYKDPKSKLWAGPRSLVVMFWEYYGRVYYDYEVKGLENIPQEGPALIVYYHGALPIDYYFFCCKCLMRKGRLIRSITDPFVLRIPGLQLLTRVMHVFSGSIEDCVCVMDKGHMLAISPGGVREAFFSDSRYRLVWGKRQGFAKVAIQAKASIIPVFTVNTREAFRCVTLCQSLLSKIYEKLRLPVVAIYGGLPVKLTTIVGKPIPYDPSLSTEEVVTKAALELEKLIAKHQRLPGDVVQALLDRFR